LSPGSASSSAWVENLSVSRTSSVTSGYLSPDFTVSLGFRACNLLWDLPSMERLPILGVSCYIVRNGDTLRVQDRSLAEARNLIRRPRPPGGNVLARSLPPSGRISRLNRNRAVPRRLLRPPASSCLTLAVLLVSDYSLLYVDPFCHVHVGLFMRVALWYVATRISSFTDRSASRHWREPGLKVGPDRVAGTAAVALFCSSILFITSAVGSRRLRPADSRPLLAYVGDSVLQRHGRGRSFYTMAFLRAYSTSCELAASSSVRAIIMVPEPADSCFGSETFLRPLSSRSHAHLQVPGAYYEQDSLDYRRFASPATVVLNGMQCNRHQPYLESRSVRSSSSPELHFIDRRDIQQSAEF